MKSATIYYFSGTGNTLLVVREILRVFAGRGIPAEMFPLERTVPRPPPSGGLLGLAFPVAAQSTYPFVWRFVEGLPPGAGTEAFMVDTLAGFSGGIVGPARKLLARKGYLPLGAAEIVMPSNFFPAARDAEKEEKTRRAGLAAARRFALSLVEGRPRWGRVPLVSDLVRGMSRAGFLWKMMRRFFPLAVDPGRCARCGLCARICPVGNIALKDLPVFAGRCEICMRCVSFCPAGAISVPGKKSVAYRAVELKEIAGGEGGDLAPVSQLSRRRGEQ